jgi:diguanylate cyclase (GGDEF)-like protein
LFLHLPAIVAFGVSQGVPLGHVLAETAVVALCALVAASTSDWRRREFGAAATAVGLVSCSAVLVHLAGGMIEMHFHFFVVLSALALYQDWLPFLVAVGYVGVHHGIVGVVAPRLVYNHPDAIAHPIRWAAVHSAFVLAAAVANIVAWRLNEEQALKDALTRLPNRRLFHDRLDQAFARAHRSRTTLAVLNIDLDGFKSINDTHGHAAGDVLLAQVAERLRRSIRATDTAARLGGDEFAVILEDVSSLDAAGDVATRILEAISDRYELGASSAAVSASIGIACTPAPGDAQDLLLHADRSMYSVKRAGGGAVADALEAGGGRPPSTRPDRPRPSDPPPPTGAPGGRRRSDARSDAS